MGNGEPKDQITLLDVLQQTEVVRSPEVDARREKEQLPQVNAREVTSPDQSRKKRVQAPEKKPAGPLRTRPQKAVSKPASGPVPAGDVRLTANIRQDIHLKLKIVAATRRTTIGDLLEELVEKYL